MNMGHNLKVMVKEKDLKYQSRGEALYMFNHLFPFNRSTKYGIGLYFDNVLFCREIVRIYNVGHFRVGFGVMTLRLFAVGVTNFDRLGAWSGF